VWKIVDEKVYTEPNDDFIGQIQDNAACDFTGNVLYSFGDSIPDLDDNV
jgi:hypothetical protein